MNELTDTQNESAPMTLAEIAGTSIDSVAEVRFEELPAMRAAFVITSFDFIEVGEKETPACKMALKVMQVIAFNDDVEDTDARREKMEGKTHNETIFLSRDDIAAGLGRVKAFLADCGFEWEDGTPIDDIGKGAAANAMPFVGDVKKRKKKDAENEFWTNVTPVASENIVEDEGDAA